MKLTLECLIRLHEPQVEIKHWFTKEINILTICCLTRTAKIDCWRKEAVKLLAQPFSRYFIITTFKILMNHIKIIAWKPKLVQILNWIICDENSINTPQILGVNHSSQMFTVAHLEYLKYKVSYLEEKKIPDHFSSIIWKKGEILEGTVKNCI